MKKINCGRCGSTHTKLASAIYTQGLRTGRQGGQWIGNSLAEQCAPPADPTEIPWLSSLAAVFVVVGTVLFGWAVWRLTRPGMQVEPWVYWTLGGATLLWLLKGTVVVAGAIGFVGGLAQSMILGSAELQQRREHYQQALVDWESTWVCLDCNHMMVQDPRWSQ